MKQSNIIVLSLAAVVFSGVSLYPKFRTPDSEYQRCVFATKTNEKSLTIVIKMSDTDLAREQAEQYVRRVNDKFGVKVYISSDCNPYISE